MRNLPLALILPAYPDQIAMSFKTPLFAFAYDRFSTEGSWYCGIDFANNVDELGVCLIHDDADAATLSVHSVVARPPVTNRTLQLIRNLLLIDGILKVDAKGRSCLPSGKNVRKASVEELQSTLCDPEIQQRLRSNGAPIVTEERTKLIEKMGHSETISEDVLSGWDFLFEAVPRFGRKTYQNHDEEARIDFIRWLFERTIPSSDSIRMTAVDSPLGTCMDFASVLIGKLPDCMSDPKLKERETENFWRKRLLAIAKKHPHTPGYFDQNSHLKSSGGLEIVPEAIYCLLKTLGAADLAKSRVGASDAKFIEAAPRVFLYSIIERIRQFEESEGRSIEHHVTDAVKNYKKDHSYRVVVLDFVLTHFTSWSGGTEREMRLALDKQELVKDNHLFDAWLCALTAWAFAQGLTLEAREMGTERERLEIEGHIIALA